MVKRIVEGMKVKWVLVKCILANGYSIGKTGNDDGEMQQTFAQAQDSICKALAPFLMDHFYWSTFKFQCTCVLFLSK